MWGTHVWKHLYLKKYRNNLHFGVWILLVLLWSYQASPESPIQRASEFLLKTLAHLGEVAETRHFRNGCVTAPGFGLPLFTVGLWGNPFCRSPLPQAEGQRVGWMTPVICSDSVISFVGSSQNKSIKWLLEKLYEFPYGLSQEQWLDFVPIQNPFRTACVFSFPFDYTGFFSVNKNSFLKLSLPLLSDSFTDVTAHSLRYDISFQSGKIVMSQNLNWCIQQN